jgi:hypothetical protein
VPLGPLAWSGWRLAARSSYAWRDAGEVFQDQGDPGVARYTSVAAQTQRAAAVASRARAVHTDYQLMARQRDERHHHVGARAVAAGHLAPGPVLALMQSYGTIRGLVFGAYLLMQRPRLMCIAC